MLNARTPFNLGFAYLSECASIQRIVHPLDAEPLLPGLPSKSDKHIRENDDTESLIEGRLYDTWEGAFRNSPAGGADPSWESKAG